MKRDYLSFDEPIQKVQISEVMSKKGSSLEYMIINDKWKIIPTGNPDKPFKKSKIK